MKRNLTLLFLFVATLAFGQFKDLATLADGKIVYHDVLYDSDENLYGYIYIYERNANDSAKTMEYVFLDKNLNKVSNQVFNSKVYKKTSTTYYDCTLMGNQIILNKYYYYNNVFTGANPLLTTFQSISIKENTISDEYCFKDNEFKAFEADFDKLKSEYKDVDNKVIIRAFNNAAFNGFYIREDVKNKEYLEKELKFFNEKRELLWSYQYNKGLKMNDYQTFFFVHVKDNLLYLCVVDHKGEPGFSLKDVEYKIVALDLLTGKTKYEYVFETNLSDFKHSLKAREINHKLYIVGDYCKRKASFFGTNPDLGFFRIVLDENGKEIEKKYNTWENFSSEIKIDKKGRVNDIDKMRLTRSYIFNDGSVTFMSEKYRPTSSGYFVFGDFILFNMKPDFSINNVKTIKKGEGKFGGDFLFSQYIKKDMGVVFFNDDEGVDPTTKKKIKILGINTLYNGEVTTETIPLSQKKKFYIRPYPAKEGYIMLREYNEKDVYNQIRLEKLNY